MHYNRTERRKLAKQFGLLTTKGEPRERSIERRERSRIAGEQIHSQFLAENEVHLREQAADMEARQLENLTASHGAEEAARIIANNKRLQQKREAKLKRKGV